MPSIDPEVALKFVNNVNEQRETISEFLAYRIQECMIQVANPSSPFTAVEEKAIEERDETTDSTIFGGSGAPWRDDLVERWNLSIQARVDDSERLIEELEKVQNNIAFAVQSWTDADVESSLEFTFDEEQLTDWDERTW